MRRLAFGIGVVCLVMAPTAALAQDLITVGEAPHGVRAVVRWPADHAAAKWVPVVMVFAHEVGEGPARAAIRDLGDQILAAGFAVVCPVRAAEGKAADLFPLFAELRRRVRIEQGALHAATGGDVAHAIDVVRTQRAEFQTFTAFGQAAKADLAAIRKLPARRVHALTTSDPEALAAHFAQLHAERTLTGAAGEVARVLDDFHDAAATGDEERYFAILPDDAVFLGTDGTERWTGAEFRAFAMPYFQRPSAWTYVALRRHVDVEPGGAVAWFDEVLDNAAYGECRGTGVMAKRGGRWVVRQYNLTVPVPNDLARATAARIRLFQDGVAPAATTIVLVRHAEKVDASDDAELSPAGRARAAALAQVLRDAPITVVFTSQFRRTAETVAPVCRARGITAKAVPAADTKSLLAELKQGNAGGTVLVCGHSNTVPEILKGLGIVSPPKIADDEFDRLFVVTLDADGARVLALRYGGT